MLSFILEGRIERIVDTRDAAIIAIASQRVRDDGTVLEWVTASVRCPALRTLMGPVLAQGREIVLGGEIEPRRREIGGYCFYDVVFVVRWFKH